MVRFAFAYSFYQQPLEVTESNTYPLLFFKKEVEQLHEYLENQRHLHELKRLQLQPFVPGWVWGDSKELDTLKERVQSMLEG